MEMENDTVYVPGLSTFDTLAEEEIYSRIYPVFRIINITLYSIIFILGTAGNGLVIWIIGFKMEKTATLIWFLNLAIADFSFCLFLPLSITEWALWDNWPFGQIMCKTWAINQQLNLSASVLFLMIISIDRCICVLYPLWAKIHRSSKLALTISVIIWFLSVGLSSPYIVFSDTENVNQLTRCAFISAVGNNSTMFDYDTWNVRYKSMSMTEFVSMFLIPFPIMMVCYGLIAFRVRKNSRIPGSGRTLKIAFTIVICFFLCWFLYHSVPMIYTADIYIRYPWDEILYYLAYCLAYFNSCLNPIIYVFIGRDFKKSLRKSIPFLLESTFRESNDPPETLNTNFLESETMT
ncbi:N-formyl peptide receptor 2 [Xenopus tropicalis]|uniref:N-formyl peptide receptor 2 n=1 Tax=Xenopus tropicalis TaxID=8364 RepID=A0A803J739_XENTR|nr:N-formyl peptide receptor 2 [Xenopus tropicalis]